MPARFTVTGGPETARALQLLGRNSTQAKVLRQALRPGARAMADAAKAAAPKQTGALARSIIVGTGPNEGQRRGQLIVGHRRDDPHQRWRISHIVEYGSRFMAAQPYMRPALSMMGTNAVREFGTAIWMLIAKEVARVRVRRALRGR